MRVLVSGNRSGRLAGLFAAFGLALAALVSFGAFASGPAWALVAGEGDGAGAPSSAFGVAAQTAGGETAAVALTVVDEQDGRIVYNGKVVGLTTGNTVADLLEAAGFAQVGEYAGNSKVYVEANGAPYFLGKSYDADTGAYWVTLFDGSSNNYADAMLTGAGGDVTLKDGGHYQYIYTNRADPATFETTFAYTDSIPDPLATDVSTFNQLLNNLAARFGAGGAGSSIDSDTYAAALALELLGKGDQVDVDALRGNAQGATSAGALAKYALALQAAGADDVASWLAKMEAAETGEENTWSTHLMLSAYSATGMAPADGAKLDLDDLIDGMLSDQADSGLFPKEWSSVQTTAQVLYALAPYRNSGAYAGIADALARARSAAVDAIGEDGVIVPNAWNQARMDYDAMGDLICALVAYDGGVGDEARALANALVEGADATLDGYADDDDLGSEPLSAATVFRGLAAVWAADSNSMHLDNAVDVRPDIAQASGSTLSKTYTGGSINPTPVLSYGGEKLLAGVDFSVSYTDKNKRPVAASKVKAAGTYYVKVTGINAFQGAKYVKLTVARAKISKASAKAIAVRAYDGRKYNPAASLVYNGKKLAKGVDFKMSYVNAKKKVIKASKVKAAGTYYVKAVGKGNFTGTKYVKFRIAK